ncbi:protein RtxH [Photobacterium sp. J15]|uniref:protein RtxH n=1 Tax=Photobacterium sp. J15 TaxID=265901 RepID=UPI0007E2E667|nr:hypothetical protein [Photobacterium sp. J15]
MSEKFVQSVSSVNYNKGVFSLYFVGQNQKNMANGIMAENDNELEFKQVVHMPASGFMYMVSMIKNMLEDPRMEAEFEKLVAAGFLSVGEDSKAVENKGDTQNVVEKKTTSKRTTKAKK